MAKIRRARAEEFQILTDLAIESEAYWGYNEDFMENFRRTYQVTKELINQYPTYIMEVGQSIVGFYCIKLEKYEVSLEYFYISPQFIGKGYGRTLWSHMTDICKSQGIKDLMIVTSPQAKEFYRKMGALEAGEVESLIQKDRKIPKLIFTVKD